MRLATSINTVANSATSRRTSSPKLHELNTKILDLVDTLKEQTIEKFFAKSDEEIGLEALLGKLKF